MIVRIKVNDLELKLWGFRKFTMFDFNIHTSMDEQLPEVKAYDSRDLGQSECYYLSTPVTRPLYMRTGQQKRGVDATVITVLAKIQA